MKLLVKIFMILVVVSCNQTRKGDSGTKKDKNESDSLKSYLSNCKCPEPFTSESKQVKIDYQGRFIKFCSWDFDSSTMKTYEFSIFDDKDRLMLEGAIPTEFIVKSIKAPFKLTQSTRIPSIISGEWEYTPIIDYEIKLVKGNFVINEKFVLKTPKITISKQDSILDVFNKKLEHNDKWDKKNPPFTTEEFVMDLFLCAVNGNNDCVFAFDNLNKKFVADGSVGELYGELSNLLEKYKKIKNN